MARTTFENLQTIVTVKSSITTDGEPFITMANELVTEKCADSSYSDTRLELIERYLAAHFYCVTDMRLASVNVDVSVSFQHKIDLYLNQTAYGQHAMLIDTDGNLAALNEAMMKGGKVSASLTWVGKTETEANES